MHWPGIFKLFRKIFDEKQSYKKFKIIKESYNESKDQNNDGTIFVDEKIEDGSVEEAEVVAHEGKHMEDMEKGILGYEDDYVEWKWKKYER